MGIDVIIVAHNQKKATINDFKRLIDINKYPGSQGSFRRVTRFEYEIKNPHYAYHHIDFYRNYIILGDGCRFHSDQEYQIRLMEMIEEISGSEPKVSGDEFFTSKYDIIDDFNNPESDLWVIKKELYEIINLENVFMKKIERIAHMALLERFYDKNSEDFLNIDNTLNYYYRRFEMLWPDYPKVFISYSHKDKHFAHKIGHHLEGYGIPIWIDSRELLIGDSLIQKIRDGLNNAEYVVALISKNSISSDWVNKELDIAMNQEIEDRRIKVLPALLDNSELPGFLKGKVYLDFRKEENFTNECEKILHRIQIDLSKSHTYTIM